MHAYLGRHCGNYYLPNLGEQVLIGTLDIVHWINIINFVRYFAIRFDKA